MGSAVGLPLSGALYAHKIPSQGKAVKGSEANSLSRGSISPLGIPLPRPTGNRGESQGSCVLYNHGSKNNAMLCSVYDAMILYFVLLAQWMQACKEYAYKKSLW